MNGRGGSTYNKSSSAKRKPSSLVLSRTVATGGAGVVVSGNPRHKNHDLGAAAGGSGGNGSGVRVGPRGGQLQLQTVSRAPPPSAGGAEPGHNSTSSGQSAGQRQQRWGAGQSEAHQRQNGTVGGAGNASTRASNNGFQQNRKQQHANNHHHGGRQPQLPKQQQQKQQQQQHQQQRQVVQAKSLPVSGTGSAGAVREGPGGHHQSSASRSLPRDGLSSVAGETAHAGRDAPRTGEDQRGDDAPQHPRHPRHHHHHHHQVLPREGEAQGGAGQRQGPSGPEIRSQNQGQQHRPQTSGGARAFSQGTTSRPGATRNRPTATLSRGQQQPQQQQQQQRRLVFSSQMQQQHQGQPPSQPQSHPHSNGNAATAVALPAGPYNLGRRPSPSSASSGQVARARGAVPPINTRPQVPSKQQGEHGNNSVIRPAAPVAGSAASIAAAASVEGTAIAREPQTSLASPSVPAAALAVGSSGVAAGAAPEGEAAALRARLAEAEAKNAEALARVRELEENNFDLEAAIQMVEVEASHRVEKQAKALQSELNFKAHQLTVAQKDHTSAVRELNAERAKRKRDSQQAARERQDAVAKAAAAAAATAAAGAAEAAAAEAAAAAAAAAQDASLRSSNGKERKQQSSIDWRRHQQQLEGDKRAVLLPPPLLSPTTLAEAILSESSEDVMVLLSAGGSAGAAAASRHLSAAADDEWAEEGGNDSSESDGDHNNGYWDASPRRRRGSDGDIGGDRSQESGGTFSPLSGAAPDSTSPVRLAPWEHRLRAEETPTTVRGASFSRPQFRHAGGAGFSAGRHADTGYVKGGSQSPQCLWGAEGEEGRGEGEREGEDFDSDADDDDGDAKSDEALEQELRRLSSQMFSCALGLLEGQACAGDLLDVLVGFLEAVPGETEYELDVLVSAVRLVYRALAVTPPAALAVALADAECDNNHDHDTASATANPLVNAGHGGGGASIPVDRKLGLDEEEPPVAVESAAATGKGKGKGRKRARSEISVTDTSRAEERGVNVDDLDEGGDAGDKQSQRHRFRGGADSGSCEGGAAAEPCPSPSLFVAGQLVTAKAAGVDTGADAEDGKSRASASVFAPSSAYRRRGRRRLSNPPTAMTSMSAVGADRGTHRGGEPQTGSGWPETWEVGGARADVGWTGTREDTDARELCRRVKGRLVGLFHRGAMYGCSTLVEVCLQTILSAVWDRNGDELLPWGGLVSLGSLNHVMSSELFRPAWELGAEVVRVLLRNAELFQAIARAGAVEGEAGQEESPLEQQQAALEAAGEAAVSGKSHTARALSLPTPGGSGGVQDGLGGDAAKLEDDGAEDNGGDFRDSLLRRLCLGAVAIGEHAPFGENIGLRLSIIRLLLSACQTYGVEAARPLFGGDGLHGGSGGDGDGNGNGGRSSSVGRRAEVGGGEWEDEEIIPALVNFVHLELEDWERRRYSEANPVESDRSLLLKEGFQLLWAIAMHSPLSLRDMVRGAGMYNTLVSVVSRFYNSLEMEKFQVHTEAMMLMEKME